MRAHGIKHVLPVCVLLLMVGFIMPITSVVKAQDATPSIYVKSGTTTGESEGEQQLIFVPRAPLIAATLSAIAPAGGQLYNEEPIKGLIVTAGEGLALLYSFIVAVQTDGHVPAKSILPLTAVYAASIIEAGVSAHLYNQHMYEQGYKAALPSPQNNRFIIGSELVIPVGLMGTVEWRIVPALGVGVEHSLPLWDTTSTQVSVKYYFNSARREQIFVGMDAGRHIINQPTEQIQVDFLAPTVGLAIYNSQQSRRFTFSIASNDWQTMKSSSGDTVRARYTHIKYGWAFLF